MLGYNTTPSTWAPLSPLAHPRTVEIRAKLEALRTRFAPKGVRHPVHQIARKRVLNQIGGEIRDIDGLPVAWPDRNEDELAPPADEEYVECAAYSRCNRPMTLESHNVVFNCASLIKPVDTEAFVKSALAGRWSL